MKRTFLKVFDVLVFAGIFCAGCSQPADSGSSSAVEVTGITVTSAGNATTMTTGGTLKLTAAVTPDNATDKTVSWTSSAEDIATVDTAGLVTAKKASTTAVTITATANDGSGKTGTFDITVSDAAASETIYYLYKADGTAADITSTVDLWSSGTTRTEEDVTGIGKVNKLASGTGWGGGAACIAFMNFTAGKIAEFKYITFKVNVTGMTPKDSTYKDICVKVPDTELPYSLADVGTAITGCDGWYKVVIPVTDFSAVAGTNSQIAILQHGTGSFEVTDIGLYGASDTVNKAALKAEIDAANTMVTTASANEGTTAGTYLAADVTALSNAITAAQTVYDDASATQTQINDALTTLTTAYNALKVITYKSPVAHTAATALAKILVTDTNITGGTDVVVTNYSDPWNGTWSTGDYTTSDNDAVKVVKFTKLNGANACGCWTITANDAIAASTGKDLYVHFDYIASADFNIKPVAGTNPVEISVNYDGTNADANGWKSADIDITTGESATADQTKAMTQFGWVSATVQDVYVTNVYFYEK